MCISSIDLVRWIKVWSSCWPCCQQCVCLSRWDVLQWPNDLLCSTRHFPSTVPCNNLVIAWTLLPVPSSLHPRKSLNASRLSRNNLATILLLVSFLTIVEASWWYGDLRTGFVQHDCLTGRSSILFRLTQLSRVTVLQSNVFLVL